MLIDKKKISLLYILLCFSVFAEETITYEVIRKSDVYSYPEKECLKNAKTVGDMIITEYPPTINFLSFLDTDNQLLCLFFKEDNHRYGIKSTDIKILNSDSLPKKCFNYNSNGISQMLIPAFYLKVLANKNSKQILDYEKTFSRHIAKNNQTITLGNRIRNCPEEFSAIVSPLHIFLNSGDEIYFKHINKVSEFVYECEVVAHVGYTAENHDYSENFWQVYVDDTPESRTEIINISLDGDYLSIDNMSKNKHIITLCYVDDSVIEALQDLFINDACNLSKVTWPRHADGSCDYN